MDPNPSTAAPQAYRMASELSKLCLPQEYKDSNRRLAWANSICCLFLLIGVVGLKAPAVHVRPLAEVVDIVPVVIVPPDDIPPPKQPEERPEPEPAADVSPETPVIATVVAADASTVTFAVPVEGPVVLAPTRLAAPPPAAPPRPVRPPANDPTKYVPSVGDWGGHPSPDYPGIAIRMGYQGTATLLITVDASGAVTDVKLQKSAGYKVLDEVALEHVRKHLRLRTPPGEVRYHTLDIVFKLQR